MTNFLSRRWYFVCFLTWAVLTTSCSKDVLEDFPDPELENIPELDITDLAALTVSQENPDGASGPEGSEKLIDGDTTTKFLIKDFESAVMDFRFDTAKLVASYELTTGNDFDGRDPLDWKFYGSNDGEQWTELDSRTGMQFRERRTTYRFYFENSQPYTHYRWEISQVYGANMFQASEFRLIQMPPFLQKSEPIAQVDSISQDGLTLIFVNHSDNTDLAYQERLTHTFFTVYPQLLEEYNPDALKRVYFIVDPTYQGVAYSFGDVILYSYDYMEGHPEDGDVVVHETMHKIQADYQGTVPGWLKEGMADFARHRFGIDDPDPWSLPDFAPDHRYDGSYGITARYLLWIETHKREHFVKELNAALLKGMDYQDFWVQSLGATIQEVWSEYALNPNL
ncbi:MAG: basic secretory protein-like protein [Sphingobacterium sp.]